MTKSNAGQNSYAVSGKIVFIDEVKHLSQAHRTRSITVNVYDGLGNHKSSNNQKITFHVNNFMVSKFDNDFKVNDDVSIVFNMNGSMKFDKDSNPEYSVFLNISEIHHVLNRRLQSSHDAVQKYLISIASDKLPQNQYRVSYSAETRAANAESGGYYSVVNKFTNEIELHMSVNAAFNIYQQTLTKK